MTWDASSDLASTLVAVAPSPTPASSLSLTVTAGAGALFPVAPFDVLIHDQAVWPTKTTAEFARVLSVVGDVVTFSARALHGSSARTILVGDRISGVFTAEQLQAIQAAIDANTAAIVTNTTALAAKVASVAAADGSIVIGGTATNPTIRSTAGGGLTSFQGRSTAAAVLTKADVTGTGLAAGDVGAALDSTAVHNTGAETVAGVKTFSSSPIVPDPTTAQQVSSKAYVDAHAGGSAMHALSLGNLTGAVTVPLASFPLTVAQGALTGNATLGFSGSVNGAKADFVIDQPASGSPFTVTVTDGTSPTVVVSGSVNPAAFVVGTRMHFQVIVQPDGSLWVTVVETAPTPITPVAPVNTVAPAVTGTATPGNTLSSTTGTWTGTPTPTYAYQWKKDGVNIGGATASTYAVVLGDATHAITCVVTATNTAGSASASSNTVTPSLSVPVNTVAPTVSGSTPVGSVLTCSPGTWTGSPAPTYGYQWTRDGTNIAGATASTYTSVSGDATHAVGCSVVGTNASGSSSAVASSNTITPTAGSSAYRTAVLADSPVAYWRMDAASGTSQADAAGSNTGTYSGSYTLGASSLLTTDADAAVNFTGGQMSAPDAAALRLGGGDITMEAWINPSAFAGYDTVITTANSAYGMLVDSGGLQIVRCIIGGTFVQLNLPAPLATGVTHHLVVTRAGTTVTCYLDGVAGASTGTLSGTTASSTGVVLAGVGGTGGNALTGILDEVALYNTALSAARVAAHYAAR